VVLVVKISVCLLVRPDIKCFEVLVQGHEKGILSEELDSWKGSPVTFILTTYVGK